MLIFPDKYPETLQLVAQAVYDYLVGHDVSAHQQAAEAAFGAAERVRLVVGGAKVYFAKGAYHEAEQRAARIYAEFNGRNIPYLARKYNLTEERIRQIVTERAEAERAARQGSLLPDEEGGGDEQDS